MVCDGGAGEVVGVEVVGCYVLENYVGRGRGGGCGDIIWGSPSSRSLAVSGGEEEGGGVCD